MKNTILAAALMLALPIGVSAEISSPQHRHLGGGRSKDQERGPLEVTGMT